jgi:hypothetical protein
MKNALFYLTYNGIYNNTNGIGTQTKTLLSGLLEGRDSLMDDLGDFDVHIITPPFNDNVFGFSKSDLEYAEKTIHQLGGQIHYCSSMVDAPGQNFWSVDNWQEVSNSAASIILQRSKEYNEILVICVDPPFLHVPITLEKMKSYFNPNIKSLITLYHYCPKKIK